MTENSQTAGALRAQVDDLRKQARKATRGLRSALKALDALTERGALDDLGILQASGPALRDPSLEALALGKAATDAASAIDQRAEGLRAGLRGRLVRELTERASADGLAVTVATEQPLTVVIAPLAVELDLAAGQASILFGREVVATCRLDAAAILTARTQAMERLKTDSVGAREFLTRLLSAYRTTLAARGLTAPERVDLVDLLLPMALLSLAPDAWHKTPVEKVPAYPRYLLAYQLYRLRREGALTHDGLRVDLGTATGGSTRHKERVLFVPTTPAEGQYYLSLRFVGAAS